MKKNTHLLTLLAWFIIPSLLLGQSTKTPMISGRVRVKDKAIEAATVSLLHAKDSGIVRMAATDKSGAFGFESLRAGRYLVSISAMGYQKVYTPPFDLTLDRPIVLPAAELVVAARQLDDVVVSGRRPLVEQKIDRTIVNVEGQATNVGLSALEVLEKSPGITIDKDGTISLKGKQGVMILIDGKPSYLSGADLTNFLQGLPSSQLELLEIMTNPPAKYDASGNAGIINIKTKKNKARGFNGALTAGAGMGNYPSSNNSINLNYRHNQWNLFGNYSLNYRKNFQHLDILRNFRDQQTQELLSSFDQSSHVIREGLSQTAKLGADFFATKRTTIGVVLTGFTNREEHEGHTTTFITDPDGTLNTRTESESDMSMRFKNFGANLNFRHQFDSTGREITADIDYLGYRSRNEQYLDNYFYDKDGEKLRPDELVYGNLPSDIRILSAKTDLVFPLKGNARLEAGLKSSLVRTDNDAQYFTRNGVDEPWTVDQGRSNHFIYEENINAAYLNMQKKLSKKWSGQLGLRLENTNARGDQKTSNEQFTRNYTQLFPTAYVQYKANEKHSWVVNYGRRIERPSYRDMNPFMYFLDKYTFEMGNPNLKPQFSHNAEITHSFKGFLNTTLNFSNTTDLITQVFEQDDATNTTFIRKDNVATRRQVGLSTNAGLPVKKWWRANLFVNGFFNEYSGVVSGGEINTSMFSWTANVQNSFTFKKGWAAELGGFYRSEMLEGVIVAQPMGVINIAVSKKMLKEKGQLRINFRDPFDIQYFRGSARYQNIDIRFENHWDNRVVSASFTYRFGKPIKGVPAKRASGSASDEQNRVGTGSN